MSDRDRSGRFVSQCELEILTDLRSLMAEFAAFRQLMDERDRRYAERDEAVKVAITKAEAIQQAYNISHNDLTKKMDATYQQMVSRAEYALGHKALEEKIADLRESRSTVTGKDEALVAIHTGQRWLIGLAVTSFLGLCGLVLHVFLGK